MKKDRCCLSFRGAGRALSGVVLRCKDTTNILFRKVLQKKSGTRGDAR